MSRSIQCPYCRRTYEQFQVIGSRIVLHVGKVSLIVGKVEEFQCQCHQSFIPVGAEPLKVPAGSGAIKVVVGGTSEECVK